VNGVDGGVWRSLVRAQDIVLAHDDGSDLAKHASLAGVQDDHVGLNLARV
jgi:hypothetical protein